MPIYDQSYAHWEGRLEGRLLRWLPITVNEIKLAFRSKISLIVFCLACTPFVVRLGMVYLYSLIPQLETEPGFAAMATVDGSFMYGFLAINQLVSVIAMCLFVGCNLISKDLKARALEIYFSKPITSSNPSTVSASTPDGVIGSSSGGGKYRSRTSWCLSRKRSRSPFDQVVAL